MLAEKQGGFFLHSCTAAKLGEGKTGGETSGLLDSNSHQPHLEQPVTMDYGNCSPETFGLKGEGVDSKDG